MDRKEEHLRLARQQNKKNLVNDFDEIRFYPHNFPRINTTDVDLSISMASWTFDLPIFFNAMTGGTQMAKEINEKLGLLAKELNIPLALGSFSTALKNPAMLDTYMIARKTNPSGFMWVNLSADVSLEKMEEALRLSKADGLQLHLNLPQEIVMPEGDRNFSNWLENIQKATQHLQVPVMVKETGFGMGQETFQLLKEAGVKIIDVGGKGGTSFTKLENTRRPQREMSYLDDYGLSTVESLLESLDFQNELWICATGGVRNPYDVVKALALGAKSVGLAGGILPLVMEKNTDELMEYFALFKEDLVLLYALLGVKNSEELQYHPLLFNEKILSYTNQRKINLARFQK